MPAVHRRLMHTRSIRVDAYERDDGLWDVEAVLTDTKEHDFNLASGVRPAGEAVHDMRLRITVDTQFNVVDAQAQSLSVPYLGYCDSFADVYRRLIGLNLMRGFHRELRERLGGVQGCTHITELAGVLPTATVQAFAGAVYQPNANEDTRAGGQDVKPHQLDRCRALRTDGEAVAKFYPRWYAAAGTPTKEGTR